MLLGPSGQVIYRDRNSPTYLDIITLTQGNKMSLQMSSRPDILLSRESCASYAFGTESQHQ